MKLRHFDFPDEFSCKCGCGFKDFDPELALKLDQIREEYGRPIIINSGCRCEKQNSVVGGKGSSDHLVGRAADISIWSRTGRYEILKLAFSLGITRIGIGSRFLHLGINPDNPEPVIWI